MPTFVQQSSGVNFTGTGVTSISATLTAITSGNLVCGFITAAEATATTCTVKDSNNLSYTMVPNSSGLLDGGNGNQAWMFYLAPGSQTGGATSITATFGVSSSFVGITVQEWSGILSTSPLDGSNLSNVAGSLTPTGTSITTTTSGDLIFAGVVPDGGSGGTITAGTGYTLRNNPGPGDLADESQIQAAAGSISGSFHFTAAVASQLGIMAFKPAVAVTTIVEAEQFLGKYTSPVYNKVITSWSTDGLPFVLDTVGTNPSFISKYTSPVYSRVQYPQATDIPTVVLIETNTHFIGRFTSPIYQKAINSWDNQGQPFVLDTIGANPHFIGIFKPYVFTRIPYNSWCLDFPIITALDDPVNFLATFQPTKFFNSVSYFNIESTESFIPPVPPAIIPSGRQLTEEDIRSAAARWLALMRWYPQR